MATSYGALDISDLPTASGTGVEFMLLPTKPAPEPIGLQGPASALWRRLVASGVSDTELSADQKAMVREFAEFGLAAPDPDHPARTSEIPKPWLISPLHELVYSLVANLARDAGARVVFIKGPALHRQGLREREHSGDVDLWVDPQDVATLRDQLIEWGWAVVPTIWDRPPLSHSVALRPTSWGCEIDLHHDLPGIGITGREALETLLQFGDQLTFAGTPASVPNTPVHAVISALHITRPRAGSPNPPTPLPQAIDVLRRAGVECIDIARRLAADGALAPALTSAFPDDFVVPEHAPPVNWRWRLQPTRLRGYTTLLRALPPSERLRLLFRLAWPDKDYVLAWDKAVGGTSRTALSARCNRLLRGARQAFTSRHRLLRPASPGKEPGR